MSMPDPIDMVLHCPKCGMQHIDAPDDSRGTIKCQRTPECSEPCGEWCGWTNPPHRSHLCAGCKHIWRPADVATNGVEAIKTRGKDDSPDVSFAVETEAQGYALEAIHQFVPELQCCDDGLTRLTPAQVETMLRRMGWKTPGEASTTADDPLLNDVASAIENRIMKWNKS